MNFQPLDNFNMENMEPGYAISIAEEIQIQTERQNIRCLLIYAVLLVCSVAGLVIGMALSPYHFSSGIFLVFIGCACIFITAFYLYKLYTKLSNHEDLAERKVSFIKCPKSSVVSREFKIRSSAEIANMPDTNISVISSDTTTPKTDNMQHRPNKLNNITSISTADYPSHRYLDFEDVQVQVHR